MAINQQRINGIVYRSSRRSSRRSAWMAVWLLVGCFFVFCSVSPALLHSQLPADRSEGAFLDALERRQLFQTIAWHCEDKFQTLKGADGRRSQLASRWIRAKTLAALNADALERDSAWAEVRSLSQKLNAESRFFPQHFLVRFQSAVIGLAEARLWNLTSGSSSAGQVNREKGLTAIRQSLAQLQLLEREILNAVPKASNKTNTDDPYDQLSRSQLQALSRDVEFQVLVSLGIRAQLYGAGQDAQASRLDTYQQIAEQAQGLQPKIPTDSLLWWQAQQLALEALRNLDQWDQWDAKWENAVIGDAPDEALGNMAAARIDMLLDRKNWVKAKTEAGQFFKLIEIRDSASISELRAVDDLRAASAWPEFDIARSRIVMALAAQDDESVGNGSNRNRLAAESAVLEFSKKVAKKHGLYWAAELSRRLLGTDSARQVGTQVSLLLLRDKIAGQKWTEVRELIDNGVQQAVASKNQSLAFDLAKLTAATARAAGPADWMVTQIETATIAFSDAPEADQLHHYANVLAALITNKDNGNLERQLAVWQRHVQNWPNRESSHALRLQLANVLVAREQFREAFAVLVAVSPDSPSFDAATKLMVPVLSDAIDQSYKAADVEPAKPFAREAVAAITPGLRKGDDWIGVWTLPKKRLALVLVQAELESDNSSALWVPDLLRKVQQQLPELDADLESRYEAVKLLADFQRSPATVIVPQWKSGDGQRIVNQADLFWLLKVFARQLPGLGIDDSETPSANSRGQTVKASQMIVTCFDCLGKDLTSPDSVHYRWLVIEQTKALLQLDRFNDAKQTAKALVDRFPKELFANQLLGYCLAGSNDPSDAAVAEQQWRMIAYLTQERSNDWFEAKYFVAESLRRQGKAAEALKLLSYLKLTSAQAWEACVHRSRLERLYRLLSSN